MAKRIAILGFGLGAYALFGISLIWLLGFLTNIGLPLTIDRGDIAPPLNAYIWNTFLLSLFGIQHSVMARPGFKRWWQRYVPSSIERSMYVLISSVLVLAICLLWKPIPGIVWQASTEVAQALWWAGFAIGIFWLIGSSFLIDHFELLGLKQVWLAARRRPLEQIPFAVRGLYKLMRHPIYVGWLLLFWCTPLMTWGHLLFAAGMTVYTLIAIRFEERDLIRAHGESYREYREQVPALVPSRRSIIGFLSGRVSAIVSAVLFVAVLLLYFIAPMQVAMVAEAAAVALETTTMERVTLDTADGPRNAVIVVPAEEEPRHLVIMLHGAGGDSNRIRLLTRRGLERVGAPAGWVVVYPEGFGKTWNDCRRTPDYPAMKAHVDDVGYLGQLVETLRDQFGVSRDNVLVAGFSNGGHMAMRLAIEKPDSIGGIVAVGAQLPIESESRCAMPSRPVHALFIAGQNDTVSPFAGGVATGLAGDPLGAVMSLDETIERFRLPGRHGNDAALGQDGPPHADEAQHLVWQLLISDGGHTIPGGSRWFPPETGPVPLEPDFASEVRRFISAWSQ